jgi:hypothetical protein
MAVVDLPSSPTSMEMGIRMLDFGGTLTPGLGGPVQRINRNGNRFAISVGLPPMIALDARGWLAALNLGVQNGVRWRFPQVELFPGSPGAVVVNGAGQAGGTLSVRGCNPNYPFRLGQFFNIVQDGQYYLHQVAAATNATSGGTATLAVIPPLRIEPSDGAALVIGQPMIEGLLEGNGFQWSVGQNHLTNISFTVLERG